MRLLNTVMILLAVWINFLLVTNVTANLQSSSTNPHHQIQCAKDISNTTPGHCPAWSYFNSAKQKCNHTLVFYTTEFFDNSTHLRVGYCLTYKEDTGIVSFASCPYFQPNRFNVRKNKLNIWYIHLPDNISKLNGYMCGSMNRKGRVCQECIDGFGLAILSEGFDFQCSNCTESNFLHSVTLFLFLEFIPVTTFYLIILIFQINITSAPMTCFIMYSQLVSIGWTFAFIGEDLNVSKETFTLNSHKDLYHKIILGIYDIWNLRFFHFLVPPFCISSNLKPFHIGLLGYISIFYPLCLIILTWICIELHGRNFRLLLWLWRPFQMCLVRLRGRWNSKSDIIDVFSSFFLLSFSKVLYQTFFFVSYQKIIDSCYNNLGVVHGYTYVTNTDLTMIYGSLGHLAYLIPSLLICFVLVVLPTLLLLLYPFKLFRRCLSLCRLDGLALKYFVERFYACYRDGLDGGRDMRSFAALYFILRPMIAVSSSVVSLFMVSNNDPYFPRNVILTVAALLIALCRPYKKTYMNVLDSLLLAHFGLICHLVSSYQGFHRTDNFVYTVIVMTVLPFVIFVLFLVHRALRIIFKTDIFSPLHQKCKTFICFLKNCLQNEEAAEQPLLESTQYSHRMLL